MADDMSDLSLQTAFVRLRRQPLHPEVNEDVVATVVHAFYARIRSDELLGPIFKEKIGTSAEAWRPHMARMCAFWSSIMLMSGRYKGNPMEKHAALSDIRPDHFDRWLELFAETVTEHCSPDVAAIFIDKSQRMSATIQRGMYRS